jgi:hypothetical protein
LVIEGLRITNTNCFLQKTKHDSKVLEDAFLLQSTRTGLEME